MYFLIKRLIRMWQARQAQRAALAPASVTAVAAPTLAATPPDASRSARQDGRSAASRGPLALLLHEAFVDLGGGGEAGAQRMGLSALSGHRYPRSWTKRESAD